MRGHGGEVVSQAEGKNTRIAFFKNKCNEKVHFCFFSHVFVSFSEDIRDWSFDDLDDRRCEASFKALSLLWKVGTAEFYSIMSSSEIFNMRLLITIESCRMGFKVLN